MDGHPTSGGGRRDAAWLLAGGAGQAAIAFAANLVLVRCIAPEVFGRFALAYAAVTAVLSLVSLRTGALVVRARALDDAARGRYWSALWFETFAAGALALLVLASGAAADGVGASLVAACLAKHAATNARGFLERRGAWRRLVAIEGAVQLLGHALAVGLALSGAGLAALVAREAAIGVASLALLAVSGGLPRIRPRWLSRTEWRSLLRESKDLWLDGALEGLHARAIVLAAGLLGGERTAGLVSQAYRLAVVPHQFLAPVAGRLAFARFAREREPRALRRRLARAMLVPLVPAALGALVLSGVVVPFVYGEAWAEVAPLLAGMCGVVLGTSLLSLIKMQLQAERAGRALLATRLVQFALLGGGLLVALVVGGALPLAIGLSAGTLLSAAFGRRALDRRNDTAPAADVSTAPSLLPPPRGDLAERPARMRA